MSSSYDSQRQESSLKRAAWQERRLITAVDGNYFHLHPTAVSSSSSSHHYKLPSNPEPTRVLPANFASGAPPNPKSLSSFFSGVFNDVDHLVSEVVPPVTVVLEGRCICQRISLHKHGSYQSLARALRQMFVDVVVIDGSADHGRSREQEDRDVDLENAIPGYMIAYEDIENDLLLAGDLNWKDFVRVAKRIRILPAKAKSRKMQKQDHI